MFDFICVLLFWLGFLRPIRRELCNMLMIGQHSTTPAGYHMNL